jgi:sulfatase maturation enzyme AslB (radical SAM superfamily)
MSQPAGYDSAGRRPHPRLPDGYFQTRDKLLTRRAVLWLGQTCNIRCHFCYFLDRIEQKDHPEHPFMDLEKAKTICHGIKDQVKMYEPEEASRPFAGPVTRLAPARG